MKHLLKQKKIPKRGVTVFPLLDCIVHLQCLPAVNEFMIPVMMECSYGLICVVFLQFSSTLCQGIPVVYENECSTLVAKVHC